MSINNLPVKKLVEFRRFSERKQSSFAKKLTVPKKANPIDSGGGGNYWIRSISGISSAFKYNNNTIIKERLDALLIDYKTAKIKNTKAMYQRNIEILQNYESFDFSVWQPSTDLKFLSKPRNVLIIKDISIQVIPHHVFSYVDNKGEPCVGGIWFVTWLDGFSLGDLGIFSEATYRYLSLHYSKNYKVDPEYCLTVDASSMETAGYNQILKGTVPSLLQSTIDTLNKYLP